MTSAEEDRKPVNIDPRCIQEALRLYFQPIKNDDPMLDFYTTYKRETMEYDTERMRKYNDDLNTTLIFAGLFSAVSSAFVIAIGPTLGPDSSKRSEAYLRAILLSLNRSVAPDEQPAVPPAWNGPSPEIVATSNLLCASLLMSLLAAFVAVLGKQWLNRYLRHAGGSMVERCGDRQRKFDGLEKWSFHAFIESLPIMLQIALLLLASGLARYMWLVNISVASIVISFTVTGFLFFIGIVIAGTSSYECPFQTPVSTTLRYLGDSAATRKFLASLPSSNVIHTIRRSIQEISLAGIISGIRSAATNVNVGHQIIILLLRVDRAFWNAKQRLFEGIRRFGRAGLLPITIEDARPQPLVPRNCPGLRVRVRNLESIRERNANNARCVCWVLRNITDPESIDSAIRLAGTIRWFDGDPDLDPPFDFVVSTLEACFDSTNQLYPGMKDRAYFSARAILQINASARAHSRERASKFPIPNISWSSSKHIDPDLHNVLSMLEHNFLPDKPTICFPRVGANTSTHLLWISNLFVELTRVGPNPTLLSYQSYLSAATANHQAVVANTLLVWYMLLGGQVEEEILWAFDKSDSLETILSHLSTRVTNVIADGNLLRHLYYLLEFLAAWEKRPLCLTPIAYKWCSAISEVAGRLGEREIPIVQPCPSRRELERELERQIGPLHKTTPPLGFQLGIQLRLGRQDLALGEGQEYASWVVEGGFRMIGSICDPVHLDDVSHHAPRGPLDDLTTLDYAHLLSTTLQIGFRLAASGPDQPTLRLDHTPHHDWVFKTAFSSHDDEVIADAMCARIADRYHPPPGSCTLYLAKRMERDTPFSPRLRRMGIHAIECAWNGELKVAGLEIVRLLDRLDVDVDDMVEKDTWGSLLVAVVCSHRGPGGLSSHYWRLLGKLAPTRMLQAPFEPENVEVMRSLEEAGDWEKLEVWMMVAWRSAIPPGLMNDIRKVTLELLSRRPSALPRFEDLYEAGIFQVWVDQKDELQRICDLARKEQSAPEPPPPHRLTPRRSLNESVPPSAIFFY